ncbi:hypothetical protein, conserved [Eimeria necatrix]|uniref:Uncharacterized protein n=1 Tax=Eimeria necatrix TaxID=51315 RepID=U6MLR8_9EIME|nr:hypothetical protein, conserved [Eimeria necatrix]CDJ63414.1 hypothetical protein, conserved [Eimeria necatrix]
MMHPNSLNLLQTKCKQVLEALLRPRYLALIPKWISRASPEEMRRLHFLNGLPRLIEQPQQSLDSNQFLKKEKVFEESSLLTQRAPKGALAFAGTKYFSEVGLEEWQACRADIAKRWEVAETLGDLFSFYNAARAPFESIEGLEQHERLFQDADCRRQMAGLPNPRTKLLGPSVLTEEQQQQQQQQLLLQQQQQQQQLLHQQQQQQQYRKTNERIDSTYSVSFKPPPKDFWLLQQQQQPQQLLLLQQQLRDMRRCTVAACIVGEKLGHT